MEDPLLELKTPTLFIIGSHSTLTSQEDVEVHVFLIVFFAVCLVGFPDTTTFKVQKKNIAYCALIFKVLNLSGLPSKVRAC